MNKNIEEVMTAKVVQAGSSFVMKEFQQTGKTALIAAKKKVIQQEMHNAKRKNLGAAEKKVKAGVDKKAKAGGPKK